MHWRRTALAVVGVVLAGVAAGTGLGVFDGWLAPAVGAQAPDPAPPPKVRPVPVVVATAKRERVPFDVDVIGTVAPSETVGVRTRIDGQIVAVHFREGDEVKAGDKLFTLDARSIQAQMRLAEANLQRDRAQLANAQRDYERKHTLVAQGNIARSTVDLAQSNYGALTATVKGDEAALDALKVQLSYTEIAAPIDGKAGGFTAAVGTTVRTNESAPLVTINKLRPVKVVFAVPQKHFGTVQAAMANGGVQAFASPVGARDAREGGKVYFVDNLIDTTTGTFQVKGEFPNAKERLWPGMLVDVVLRLGVDDGVVVPSAAIQTGQPGTFVFVIKPDRTAEVRKVEVARETGDLSVVDKGLDGGETVVVDGQLRLSAGTKVEIRSPGVAKRGSEEG